MNITAHSSHGTVTFDSMTGKVVLIEEYLGSEGELSFIKKVDVVDLRLSYTGRALPCSIDILDIGYWTDERYEPPVRGWAGTD